MFLSAPKRWIIYKNNDAINTANVVQPKAIGLERKYSIGDSSPPITLRPSKLRTKNPKIILK